jgi:predicted ribosome quality control (RQC) complex YloA/Tae2 family protein
VKDATLKLVKLELEASLVGRKLGRIFPLGRHSIAIDFRLHGSKYLFISSEPASPRVYLIHRRLRDLERQSENPQPFHLLLRKHLAGAGLKQIEKSPNDRILTFRFESISETGDVIRPSLVAQLTGRSSNLFLLNGENQIVGSLIEKEIDGQRIGESYEPKSPPPRRESDESLEARILPEDNGSVSAALDRHFEERNADQRFRSRADNAMRTLLRDIAKRRKLIAGLRQDLIGHGDAERWKRYGDLILANLSTARHHDGKIIVVDYFDENAPEIEIEADESWSLTHAAQNYFKRYTKASNAETEIARRIAVVEHEIAALESKKSELEKAIIDRDESFFVEEKVASRAQKAKKGKTRFAGARAFTSSDGYEILVGKKASDNDHITFRIAGSLDTWLHAADYPGSHVVIRNPNRKEIPQKTLLEAAQLAAFYSVGRSQPKAAVNYTQKKFVNKPRGASPGLVRLASFKTILVEPSIPKALDQNSRR